jgi:hypothetical protein
MKSQIVSIKPTLSKVKQTAQREVVNQYEMYKSLYKSIVQLAKKPTVRVKVTF